MQWRCQLVVKTGTPLTGEVDGPSPGGVTLFQGEFSTPTGWLDKPLGGNPGLSLHPENN